MIKEISNTQFQISNKFLKRVRLGYSLDGDILLV